ncbi:SMI1/KNR4 family protein [Escherichia albertii]
MPIVFGKGMDLNEIKFIEDKFSIKFPHDYILFLHNCNGFYINGTDGCDIEFGHVDNKFISFESLFGVDFINDNFNLLNINDCYLNEISFIENSFIIGSDPGGNFYILITKGNLSGVYYWDRTHLHADDTLQEYAIAEVNECGNLYKVSDSFDNFFSIIKKLTEGMPFS